MRRSILVIMWICILTGIVIRHGFPEFIFIGEIVSFSGITLALGYVIGIMDGQK